MNQTKKLHPAIAALIVVALIGIVASVVIVVNSNKSDETAQVEESTTTTSNSTATTESTDTSAYQDGTYSATGSYISPGGRQSIELTVTIVDGVITDTTIVNKSQDSESKEYQEVFAAGYKTLVVGKSIDEVSLSRVAGSSLTSNGFNDALDQIKDDAKA